jgi:hypothetical protein
MSHAFTQDNQRRLCTGDVLRLCGSEIPSVQRIAACMRKQWASLSEGCRSVFGKPAEQSAGFRQTSRTIGLGEVIPGTIDEHFQPRAPSEIARITLFGAKRTSTFHNNG